MLKAVDNDDQSLKEVARVAGAAGTAQYFGLGVDGNVIKATNGGLLGFYGATPGAQQAHIIDADGQLADITTKFNTLLSDLEGYGLLADS